MCTRGTVFFLFVCFCGTMMYGNTLNPGCLVFPLKHHTFKLASLSFQRLVVRHPFCSV